MVAQKLRLHVGSISASLQMRARNCAVRCSLLHKFLTPLKAPAQQLLLIAALPCPFNQSCSCSCPARLHFCPHSRHRAACIPGELHEVTAEHHALLLSKDMPSQCLCMHVTFWLVGSGLCQGHTTWCRSYSPALETRHPTSSGGPR